LEDPDKIEGRHLFFERKNTKKISVARQGTRVRAIQAQIPQLDPPRVSQLFRAHHGLLHVQSFQQGEDDSGLDFLELPTSWDCQLVSFG
jgi:hypothetical protein